MAVLYGLGTLSVWSFSTAGQSVDLAVGGGPFVPRGYGCEDGDDPVHLPAGSANLPPQDDQLSSTLHFGNFLSQSDPTWAHVDTLCSFF